MEPKASAVKLIIEDPYMDLQLVEYGLKGRLFVAKPAKSKPHAMSFDAWVTALLDHSWQLGHYKLAIPRSFWRTTGVAPSILPTQNIGEPISVVDDFCGFEDYDNDSPIYSVRAIIECLEQGNDVLILSATKQFSGFIPAIVWWIFQPEALIKLLWTVSKNKGYELTPFQLGYLYGLDDAVSPFGGVQKIRNKFSKNSAALGET